MEKDFRAGGKSEGKEGRKRGFEGAFNGEFLEMTCGDGGSG